MLQQFLVAAVYRSGLLAEALLLNSKQLLPRPRVNIYYAGTFPSQEEIDALVPGVAISLLPARKYAEAVTLDTKTMTVPLRTQRKDHEQDCSSCGEKIRLSLLIIDVPPKQRPFAAPIEYVIACTKCGLKGRTTLRYKDMFLLSSGSGPKARVPCAAPPKKALTVSLSRVALAIGLSAMWILFMLLCELVVTYTATAQGLSLQGGIVFAGLFAMIAAVVVAITVTVTVIGWFTDKKE
jgi:hypothetical protein